MLQKNLCARTALALAALGGPLFGTELPPGFVEEPLVSLNALTGFARGPEGEIWLAGKEGGIWRFRDGVPAPIARLGVDIEGEHGVVGIAVDPDFAANARIWIYYIPAGPPPRGRLAHFRSIGSQLVDETVVLETSPLTGLFHTGGCLRFARDGTLFVSTGDDGGRSTTAQNPFDLKGKLLHINRDGSPAAGNPFLDGSADPRVWALGLRNPWRFSIQPGSGTLFIGDVGETEWEEINLGVPGANYGWALVEGSVPPGVAGITYPLYEYPHVSAVGESVIGGDHVPGGSFPEAYVGNYIFADSTTREFFRIALDAANQPLSIETWATGASGPITDIQFGPDGALYYTDFFTGLHRISYTGTSNRQPAARFEGTPDSGSAPLEVVLDASASVDPDGTFLSYTWDFGDGQTSVQGPTVSHSYEAGSFRVTLVVTDAGGASARAQAPIVSGNQRPGAMVRFPRPGRRYGPDEVIEFSGLAADPEDGLIGCEHYTWRVTLHHLEHTHPALGPVQGACGGTFTTPPHGEGNTHYEIVLTAQDSGAGLGQAGRLTATASVEIFPR